MNRKFLLKIASCLMLVAGILTASCSNEDTIVAPQKAQELTMTEVANVMKSIDIDVLLANEIHGFVTDAMISGYDEKISFKKMLSDGVKTRANAQSLISERIKSLIAGNTKTRSGKGESYDMNILDKLMNSDFIIYWPYSENWDGKELPALVVAPEDEDAKEAYGMKICRNKNGLTYEKVLINEDYAEQHPVWVINEEVEDPNIMYATLSNSNVKMEKTISAKNIRRSPSNPIYVWRLKKMKVTKQYDGLFRGGSDFDIQVVYPISAGSVALPSKFRVYFSRKDIRKKKEKDVNVVLNTNWLPSQVTNAIVLTEGDRNGSDINIKLSLTYKDPDSGLTSSVEGNVSYKSNDEFIGQQVFNRNYMLQDSIIYFDNEHVKMTAPISVE